MTTWAEYAARRASRKIYTATVTVAQYSGGLTTKDIYLATEAIRPDLLGSNYYQPRLKGVPSFSRQIQEVFKGQTQVSFGSLDILNGDGGLDDDVEDWTWAGGAIEIDLGFEGLALANYERVFTGKMGQPTITDAGVQVPIMDDQAACWTALQASGTYNDTLANLVDALLTAAGITSKDATMWTTWASENGFTCWYQTAEDTAVGSLLDALLAPLACWWGISRSGLFQIGTFKAPTGSPDITFGAFGDDPEVLDFKRTHLDRYWKMTLQYYNSPPTTATTSQSDSTILTLNPLALEGTTIETCLTSSSDASTVLTRWWNLLSVQRQKLALTAKVAPFAVEIHDVLEITRERFDIDTTARITLFKEDHIKNQITLEAFM